MTSVPLQSRWHSPEARPIRNSYLPGQTIRLDVVASPVHGLLLLFREGSSGYVQRRTHGLWTTPSLIEISVGMEITNDSTGRLWGVDLKRDACTAVRLSGAKLHTLWSLLPDFDNFRLTRP
jgi:coenzyme PQQ precursor peptide PqqA